MKTINDLFLELKTNLELSSTVDALVQQRHAAIRQFIENNHLQVTDTKLIGSIRRKTRIQPQADAPIDIDILVVMGTFTGWLAPGHPNGITVAHARERLHHTVSNSDRYGAMNPQQVPPTISLEYSDRTKVELVPAYIDQIGMSPNGARHTPTGRGYWVPKDNSWELSDYDYEADYVSQQNAATGGLLLPTIKMLKALKRKYFPQMSSFHLEIVATTIIPWVISFRRERGMDMSYPELVKAFFSYAPNYLATPVRFAGSNSQPVGIPSSQISQLTETLKTISSYIEAIGTATPESKKVEMWKTLFDDAFPAT